MGSVLVPKLLQLGYSVLVMDIMWFGNNLPEHRDLTVSRCDIRNAIIPKDVKAVIHLAAVVDDPTSELNHEQTWEIGALGTQRMCRQALNAGALQFIHASSGSVYGVNTEGIETTELNPFSYYNKVKMVAERVALSYRDEMVVQIIRPASICGLSPRMRLEVTVNQYTIQALDTGKINVYGGARIHPNVHIEDITDLYIHMLRNPHHTGVFNSTVENIKKLQIAEKVAAITGAEIIVRETSDIRSYPMNDNKIRAIGFTPLLDIDHAIADLCAAYRNGLLKNEDRHYNLRVMKVNNA